MVRHNKWALMSSLVPGFCAGRIFPALSQCNSRWQALFGLVMDPTESIAAHTLGGECVCGLYGRFIVSLWKALRSKF